MRAVMSSAASRTNSATSVVTWSLRERAVCSRPPARPVSSVTPALDGHVDVLVRVLERERALAQLGLHGIQAAEQRSEVVAADDPACREHAGVGARLRDVVGPEALVEVQRAVDRRGSRGPAARRSATCAASLASAHASWPTIAEPELRRRICFDEEQFRGFVREFIGSVPRRELTDELYAHALGYPWARPASSFVLRGEHADSLDELDAAERERALSFAGAPGRHALLAFGSNGAPDRLALKFKELPESERDLLVLAGTLHDFDVGAAPMPTFYGALPATIFPSPGAAVRLRCCGSATSSSPRSPGARSATGSAGWRACASSPTPRTRRRPPACSASSRAGARCASRMRSSRWRPCRRSPAGPAMSQEALLDHVAALVIGPRRPLASS